MRAHATDLAETFVISKGVAVSGAAGAVAAVTPADKMARITGDWLMVHGIGVLSYAEIIQIIGAAWVTCLIVDRIIAGIKLLIKKSGKKE